MQHGACVWNVTVLKKLVTLNLRSPTMALTDEFFTSGQAWILEGKLLKNSFFRQKTHIAAWIRAFGNPFIA